MSYIQLKPVKPGTERAKASRFIKWLDFRLAAIGKTIDDVDVQDARIVAGIIHNACIDHQPINPPILALALDVPVPHIWLALRGCSLTAGDAFRWFAADAPFYEHFPKSDPSNMNAAAWHLLDNGFLPSFVQSWLADERQISRRGKAYRIVESYKLRRVVLPHPIAALVTPADILPLVLEKFGVQREEVAGLGRMPEVVMARSLFDYLCREYTTASYPDICDAMGRPRSSHSASIERMGRFIELYMLNARIYTGRVGKYPIREVAADLERKVEALGKRYCRNEVIQKARKNLDEPAGVGTL
jgi:hypothetical protein